MSQPVYCKCSMDIVKVTPAVSSSASAATPVKQQKSKKVRWQAYVDNALLRTGQVNQAAIFGLDGVQWASSKDFKVLLSQEYYCYHTISSTCMCIYRLTVYYNNIIHVLVLYSTL